MLTYRMSDGIIFMFKISINLSHGARKKIRFALFFKINLIQGLRTTRIGSNIYSFPLVLHSSITLKQLMHF